MRTGTSSSAAKNAACSAMLRILPPVTLSLASLAVSSPSVGVSAGKMRSQIRVRLHTLQEVAALDVGVAVVAVLDLAALAEECVGLVEEQHRPALLRRV